MFVSAIERGIGISFLGATDRSVLVARTDGSFCFFTVLIGGLSWAGGEIRSPGASVANSIAGHLNSSEFRHNFATPGNREQLTGQLVEPPALDRSRGDYRRWRSALSSLSLCSDVAEDLGDSLGIKDEGLGGPERILIGAPHLQVFLRRPGD